MDPVEKTFDTVYYLGKKAQSSFNTAVNTVGDTTSSISDKVISAYGNLSGGDSSYVPASADARSSYSGGFWDLSNVRSFYNKNKALNLLLGASVLGISGYYLQKVVKSQIGYNSKIKRRAQRLPNGARKDVVLIVGSVTEPLTRYIANDLETRGFIVYITSTNSKADVKFFNNESIQDIKSLIVSNDPANDEFNAEQIRKFDYLLSSDHIPFQGAEPNKLNLVGIILIPDLYFPSGKLHMIPCSTWTYNIQNKMLLPFNLLINGLIGIAEKFDSNLIFVTPTLSSSVQLTYHSVENITSNFLQTLSQNLAQDYEGLNITNLKLGSICINSNNSKKNFGIKGKPLKTLHYKIFDILYGDDNNSIEYVGTGARFLDHFGSSLIPRWLIRNYFNNYFGN